MVEAEVNVDNIIVGGGGSVDVGGSDMPMEGGDGSLGMEIETPFVPMASWPFVIGITGATLLVSVVLGIFLAKRKIKKGLDLYED